MVSVSRPYSSAQTIYHSPYCVSIHASAPATANIFMLSVHSIVNIISQECQHKVCWNQKLKNKFMVVNGPILASIQISVWKTLVGKKKLNAEVSLTIKSLVYPAELENSQHLPRPVINSERNSLLVVIIIIAFIFNFLCSRPETLDPVWCVKYTSAERTLTYTGF